MATSSSSKISSGVNLTSNFFLQNFYKHNRNAIKISTRSDYSKTELSYEDSTIQKMRMKIILEILFRHL